MGPSKLVDFQGRKVLGRSIEFEPKNEPWAQYQLEDGSIMKVKVVLLDIIRLEEYAPTGEPLYQFSMQQITAVSVPDELKKQPN